MVALHHQAEGHPWLSLLFVLLYGCQANFAINGMHELGHGFVFKTQWLQNIFLRVFSFIGWLHPDMFFSSHFRHHRYTQNFPHDQEAPQTAAEKTRTERGLSLYVYALSVPVPICHMSNANIQIHCKSGI